MSPRLWGRVLLVRSLRWLQSSQTFTKEGRFRLPPSFMPEVFFLSWQNASCQRFSVVALPSAVMVQDRRKESGVLCEYEVRLRCASAFFLRYL